MSHFLRLGIQTSLPSGLIGEREHVSQVALLGVLDIRRRQESANRVDWFIQLMGAEVQHLGLISVMTPPYVQLERIQLGETN